MWSISAIRWNIFFSLHRMEFLAMTVTTEMAEYQQSLRQTPAIPSNKQTGWAKQSTNQPLALCCCVVCIIVHQFLVGFVRNFVVGIIWSLWYVEEVCCYGFFKRNVHLGQCQSKYSAVKLLFTHASSQCWLSHACLFRYFLFIFSRYVFFSLLTHFLCRAAPRTYINSMEYFYIYIFCCCFVRMRLCLLAYSTFGDCMFCNASASRFRHSFHLPISLGNGEMMAHTVRCIIFIIFAHLTWIPLSFVVVPLQKACHHKFCFVH